MKLIINNNKSQTRVEMSALRAFCVEGRAYMREATRGWHNHVFPLKGQHFSKLTLFISSLVSPKPLMYCFVQGLCLPCNYRMPRMKCFILLIVERGQLKKKGIMHVEEEIANIDDG